MFEFSVAYVCLAIGFMMAFMILFSAEEPFTQFPGSLVSVGLVKNCDVFFIEPKLILGFGDDAWRN